MYGVGGWIEKRMRIVAGWLYRISIYAKYIIEFGKRKFVLVKILKKKMSPRGENNIIYTYALGFNRISHKKN